MAAQDVAELVPRVRRAIEGPTPDASVSDDTFVPVTADAIGDLILVTAGTWPHKLEVTTRSDGATGYPTAWGVDPGLDPHEEGLVAMQAALNYAVVWLRDMKVSEAISDEAKTWEWTKSASALRDWLKTISDMRDQALEALEQTYPVMVRVRSFLQVRDMYRQEIVREVEPWLFGGLGGNQLLPAEGFPGVVP